MKLGCWPRDLFRAVIVLTVSCSLQASGSSFPAEVGLNDLLSTFGGDGTNGFVANGATSSDRAGADVSVADVDGDGIDDLVVLARFGAGTGGRGDIFVVFGQPGGFPAEVDLGSLLLENGGDGSNGLVFRSGPGDRFDQDIATADVNCDSRQDIIVGKSSTNSVLVFFGAPRQSFVELDSNDIDPDNGGDGSQGFSVIAGSVGFGDFIVGAGDVNGDGCEDVLIADATSAGFGAPSESGVVFLWLGRPTFSAEYRIQTIGDLSGLGTAIFGQFFGEELGTELHLAGDVNGDGLSDLLLKGRCLFTSNPALDSERNRYYLLYGQETLPTILPISSTEDVNVASFISGDTASVVTLCEGASAGDFNNDAKADLIFGIETAETSVVIPGAEVLFPAESQLSNLLQEPSLSLTSSGQNNHGRYVRGVGDVNADGYDDVLIAGSQLSQTPDPPSFVVFGRPIDAIELFSLDDLYPTNGGTGELGFLIYDVFQQSGGVPFRTAHGDINFDGAADLVHGVQLRNSANGQDSGQSFVLYGRTPDSDGDQVADSLDNCLSASNIDQNDTDGDGYGNACDADLNNDCIVNSIDLGIFRSVFFTQNADADFDGDGNVNSADLGIFRTMFFRAPGPSGVDQLCD